MRLRNVAAAIVLGLAAWYAAPSLAAPCSGFTDVDDTSLFCPNVDWLKNRSITLGCTSTTTYCPSNFVTRLEMAAFLNRLGAALTTTFLTSQGPISADLSSPVILCSTGEVMNDDYPRMGLARANVYSQVTADAVVQFELIYTGDDGLTWNPVGAVSVASAGTATANSYLNATVLAPVLPFAVMADYKFALRATRLAGTGNLTGNNGCSVQVEILNRNGTSAPF